MLRKYMCRNKENRILPTDYVSVGIITTRVGNISVRMHQRWNYSDEVFIITKKYIVNIFNKFYSNKIIDTVSVGKRKYCFNGNIYQQICCR